MRPHTNTDPERVELRRCGALLVRDGSCFWRVWAPRAHDVELLLFDERNGQRVVAMHPESDGYFTHVEPAILGGQRYAFRLDGGLPRPDPCSRWQPEGVHQPSAVLVPERSEWSERDWAASLAKTW